MPLGVLRLPRRIDVVDLGGRSPLGLESCLNGRRSLGEWE
jgi:hypothetical protein